MYNLYLYDNTTLYSVDYTSAVPTQTLLLQLNTVPLLPPGSSFLSVAVYIDEPTNVRTIYYGSKNATSGSTSFYMHRDGITTKLVTPIDAVTTTPLVTNGIYLFCPCTLENRKYSAICGFSLFDSNNKGYIDESFQPIAALTYQSIGISSNSTNNRMFITASSDQTHTTNQYFFYQNGFYMEGLANQYNFAAGWFTCGDEIIAPVSALTTTYTSECSSNGIVGEVLYQEQNRYLFTPTDAATYAISNSAPYCPAIYEQACNVVADLPPYSCTKRKYPTVFTVLGTAFANCMALLSLIIFASSIILTYLSKYYPPDDERSMSRMDNFSTNAENDVELGAVSSTVNPISASK
uniref:Uncharacterized protein n=1 Tax=Spumella elongata TaxID=89044 RepID=A0A7S3H112_9STRA